MKYLILFILLGIFTGQASEICSRVAVINYQEVLVDAGSTKKGEGLRFYLEKDPVSARLLDEYQEKNQPRPWTAGLSTAGSLMILGGFMQTSGGNVSNRNNLIYGGGILIAISYLTSKTIQHNNEGILQQAVDQYNKRNKPKIFFTPYRTQNSTGFGVGLNQEF